MFQRELNLLTDPVRPGEPVHEATSPEGREFMSLITDGDSRGNVKALQGIKEQDKDQMRLKGKPDVSARGQHVLHFTKCLNI